MNRSQLEIYTLKFSIFCRRDQMKKEAASPTSSPPTPPSPLPVSVGPGSQRYLFPSSPSLSPPFSPLSSSHTSVEDLPLLKDKSHDFVMLAPPLTFSLDLPCYPVDSAPQSSCLKDLLEWFVAGCFSCCSWAMIPLSKPHGS
ncbi:hypothetical protein Nepgr_017912 [Nepenthes gracilis]|uniref:Uncharacterized protein n=1 Tax=Nepenthes gracilis TaxID=150966 RepID=A0AAD3STM3_NEPGR|nr:hypothetical protein Nepgr_017912 [Nepenthes gracilis]